MTERKRFLPWTDVFRGGGTACRNYLAAAQRLGLSEAASWGDTHQKKNNTVAGCWMTALPLAEQYPDDAWNSC